MKRSVKNMIRRFAVHGIEDYVGDVTDCYFDDIKWAVRYLVVLTGSWLDQREVLVSPISVTEIEWDKKTIHVSLTRPKIEGAPDIDTKKPISRRIESDFNRFYRFPMYWFGTNLWGNMLEPRALGRALNDGHEEETEEEALHLRSVREVLGYQVQGKEKRIGRLYDFVLDDRSWALPYIIVDIGTLFQGKKKLIQSDWIGTVSWDDKAVCLEFDRDRVESEPNIRP